MATRGSSGCATPTPTATPACTPTVITGSIDNTDPTQVDRLFRSFTPGDCDHTFTCSTLAAGAIHYNAYTFTNTTGSTQCVTVDMNTACAETNFIFTAAYLSSFDPNNICANWIADEGESPNPQNQFSFKIDAGQTYILVVSEVNAGAGCPDYTMTVTCEPYQPPPPICPPTITQSTSQAIVDFNALACTDPGIGTLENHYWRAFDMNTFKSAGHLRIDQNPESRRHHIQRVHHCDSSGRDARAGDGSAVAGPNRRAQLFHHRFQSSSRDRTELL